MLTNVYFGATIFQTKELATGGDLINMSSSIAETANFSYIDIGDPENRN
jgi:hypothetical protein